VLALWVSGNYFYFVTETFLLSKPEESALVYELSFGHFGGFIQGL